MDDSILKSLTFSSTFILALLSHVALNYTIENKRYYLLVSEGAMYDIPLDYIIKDFIEKYEK